MPIETFEQFAPQVHPLAFIHSGAYLIGDVTVGEEASVWPTAVLRGDQGAISIGARSSIQDGAVVHATLGISTTAVGEECTVGHRAVLHGCTIGARCLVGMGSILLDGVELGEGCFVAAGSLLTPGKVFPPRSFVVGSPGRALREVTAEQLEWIRYSWQAYVDLARRNRR